MKNIGIRLVVKRTNFSDKITGIYLNMSTELRMGLAIE